jgi:hypothetical protein
VAPVEFRCQERTSQMMVDKTLDLTQVIDLCLETHYNACMNSKAMADGSVGFSHLAGVFNR